MGAATIEIAETFSLAAYCVRCGVAIVMPQSHERALRRSHDRFYCINGHPQSWPGKSDIEELRDDLALKERQLASARANEALAQHRERAAKGEVTKIKNRVGNGVCPCCNRTFQNLMRHMSTKHPDFKESK